MSIKDKMKAGFRNVEGGLFSKVSKADVGDAFVELAKNGVTLMGWADPFTPDATIPEHIKEVMIKSLNEGTSSHYTMPIGNSELKIEIAKKLKKYNKIDVDPKRNILITPGSDIGLFYSMMPFIEQGDEVMVPDPSYPNNFLDPELMGGVTVRIPLYEKDNYQPKIEEFEKRLTDRTKLVLLTNPNNPTSTVFRRENLEKLANFIIENDLILVVDQAFEDCIFDNIEYVSMCSLPGMWERTVTVFSVSKGMALSGFRVGYIVANDQMMDVFYGSAVNVLGAANTVAQIGTIEAFKDSSFMEEYNKIHDRRRKFVYELFKSTPGVSILKPESSFISWLNVSKLGDSSDICDYLIKEAKVAVNDGKAYGKEGEGHIRVVHGCLKNDEDAFDALRRMNEAFIKLANKKGIK